MTKATLARGRCIEAVIEGADKEIAGYDVNMRKYVYPSQCPRYMPGEVVTLPASEVRRLRQLGFLLDEDAPPIERTGPKEAA